MPRETSNRFRALRVAAMAIGAVLLLTILSPLVTRKTGGKPADPSRALPPRAVHFQPRYPIDPAGFLTVARFVTPWKPYATLAEISQSWEGVASRSIEQIDRQLAERPDQPNNEKFMLLYFKATILNSQGEPKQAYQVLEQIRSLIESCELAGQALYSMIYFQGVTSLRRGENENCILCRGESSCIIPILPAAIHIHPEGSRLAIKHFTEYLDQFPDDLEVRWLLNVAHMTLGEHPDKVDPRYLVSLDHYLKNEFDIGKFRDIGHIVGLDQFTQGGGGIMEDFDNDGLLDIVTTAFDPTSPMFLLRNTGQGTFEDRSAAAALKGQLGGINCMQTDYNNDGRKDIFIVRGAWLPFPMRPTLLRNEIDGTFTDVTEEAGLLEPGNSITASWADYDNDGWLDLFVCCEGQPSRLHHNLKDGTFEAVAVAAGVSQPQGQCKGVAWIDYDNDGFPDLFLNFLSEHGARLYRNNRDGTFQDVSSAMGIDGPVIGFSCWAWDYDNDGWLDLFATCYERSMGEVVKGLLGQPHAVHSNRLYRNLQGQGFQDVTKESGLDQVFQTMGGNFGDFDNDGFLDMYLGTGQPDIAVLVPNRMFKNVDGKRFSEITASSRTGNLQKGHGTACGDWDRDGNTDIFMEMGGAINGDIYHNILFQNPGHDNSWLTIKLTGQQTNRAAIGARIKIVMAGDVPRTIHRHISSGSSFGANPLQQTIGLGPGDRIAVLEIHWPTSGTTQIFRDVAVNQCLAITEFADDYQKLDWPRISIPDANSTMNRHGD